MSVKWLLPEAEPGEEERKFDALDYADLTSADYKSLEGVHTTFWYYDLSLSGGPYCFNGPNISVYDYQQYFATVSTLSTYAVVTLLSDSSADKYLIKRRFHRVNVGKYKNLKAALKAKFKIEGALDELNCPLIYQIGLYSSDECKEPEGSKKKAPRLFFRLTERGAFSMFLLDIYHELCPAKDRSSN